jgi:5-methylcytosine-specific restriction enzyme A
VPAGQRCPTCTRLQKRSAEERRQTAAERGYDHQWRQARAVFLARNPLCCDRYQRHGGVLVPATIGDHREPHKGAAEKFWDTENWDPLCEPCHRWKSAALDGAFGNPRRAAPREHGTLRAG